MGLLIRRARLDGRILDVRMDGALIAETGSRLAARPGDEELNGEGGEVIPGLHDHHIHLRAWAASKRSVSVGPADLAGRGGFASVLRETAATGQGWLRAVGYHESVAGELDRHALDRIVSHRPLRLQHRSGILWVLNSVALKAVGADDEFSPGIERDSNGVPTGRLWRMDGWLGRRLEAARPPEHAADAEDEWGSAALAALSREAASLGVTGWTDATPGRGLDEVRSFEGAAARGWIRQRLHLMLPVGVEVPPGPVTPGPVKVILDDTDLPALHELCPTVSAARREGRAVAVHCVTRAQLALAVAAFDEAESNSSIGRATVTEGDRIEHGADVPEGYLALLAQRALTVVTQPGFVYERGDNYLEDVDAGELSDLWRGRSLIDAGIPVAAGTDAPFGSPDPWLGIRAAVRRRTRSGRTLGADEAVDARTSLGLWLGSAARPATERVVAAGEPADLVVLDEPLATAVEGEGPVVVRVTIIAGEVVFHR